MGGSITKVYFVRHAKPDFSVKDDLIRPLTEEGINASKKVTEFLMDKNITKIYSSPYKRAIDTIKDFSEKFKLDINVIDDFRERKIDSVWIEDFVSFSKNQWKDFNYKLDNGESLGETQKRNIEALINILKENQEGNIVVGSHGTALSTVINYFKKDFGYCEFERIRDIMPFIVCLTFDGQEVVSIEEIIL